MYKIAVMGDKDSIYGFASIGMDIFPVMDTAQAGKQLRTLVESDYAVIFMTEALFEKLQSETEKYRATHLPAIIPIPGTAGNTGLGVARVKQFVEQAVGSDILFGKH